jgi:S1-C subfamily serine protease
MADAVNPLTAFSDIAVQLVERAASSIVSVRGGGRQPSSGIHWRSGVVVTAEEALEADDKITVVLPGGREVEASLAGRDPTTDVAALRFQPDGLPTATTSVATTRPGQFVAAVGSHDGAPLAALGAVAYAGGAWRSMRGGAIDSLIRLDLRLSPVAEGGAVVDDGGGVIGMAVLGPRGRPLAIPTSTIDRAVDQLLSRGHVFRGYLGAGLQNMRENKASGSDGRGVLVVSIDPDGPSKRAGAMVGDIIVAWDGKLIERVRDVMQLLGPESVGSSIELKVTRGGAPVALRIVVGERPVT